MTKKVRFRAKRAALHAKMMEIERTWVLSHTRGREPFKQVRAIFEAVLSGPTALLSREDLIDQHRRDNRLSLDVAMAEVDQHHPKIVEDLRRNGMPLVHPVTKYGFKNADTVAATDKASVANCVPGAGAGGPTYGWRLAHLTDDPVWLAYVQHRYHSGHKAVQHSTRLIEEGAKAGLLPAPNVPLLPDKIA